MSYSYSVSAQSPASPDVVYEAIARASTWPSWSPVRFTVEIEGGGDPAEPQQVGDVRIFHTRRGSFREPVVEMVPHRLFVYENTGGPFRSYRGAVELTETPDGGTHISWSADFVPIMRGTGRLWSWYLTRFMRKNAGLLADYAEAQMRR